MKKYLIPCGALIIALITFHNQISTDKAQSGITFMQKPTTDPLELKKIVTIEHQINNLKWELFGTPEWSGTPPAPTDFASIIITGEISDAKAPPKSEDSNLFIPQNSKRNWLNHEQNLIIASLIEGKNPLPPVNCITRTFKSSSNNEDLEGIECRYNSSIIIIIIVKQPTL